MKFTAAALLLIVGSAHAQYKCVDAEGKTTFQQTACPAAQKQQALATKGGPPALPGWQ